MKRLFCVVLLLLGLLCGSSRAAEFQYIACKDASTENSWVAWRRDVTLSNVPKQVQAKICCDSKYWLWVNGKMVIFEGCLKRGPNKTDSYYDIVDLTPWLRKGENKIAILQWYFGKSGFSHLDSGSPAFCFDAPAISLVSDENWLCRIHPSYSTTDEPRPNYRLSEANIRFDERKNISGWQTDSNLKDFSKPAVLQGEPLGKLVERPIPQWKDFGEKKLKWTQKGDTLSARLPYNMQFTPIVKIKDNEGGKLVKIESDHAYHGKAQCIRAEYITAPGTHSYESLGWINGEELLVILPKGAKLLSMGYRETGYDSHHAGKFHCDSPFFMKFYDKAVRTLYVNMRDNFFDCPDRERAQWWGDIVTLQGEAFYTFDTRINALIRKAIDQLCAFQREDGTLYSPIPGTYNKELPAQMLSAVGRYGFWTYYLYTGDKDMLRKSYPAVKTYLSVWELDETGLTAYRKGGWSWGDWGKDIDIRLILGAWHYMALEGAASMADELGLTDDAKGYRETMKKVADGFNACWNGKNYRHPSYEKATDDRVQALAVVSGIAPKEWWPAIFETLKTEEHASPYLEKYVTEALFIMGKGDYAMQRAEKRFSDMVSDPVRTTMFEGWRLNDSTFGGGTSNHAWSGGTITVIATHLCGIRPLEAGWKKFEIAPQCATFKECSIEFPTVAGTIGSSWKMCSSGKPSKWTITVPEGCTAIVRNPWNGSTREFGPGKHSAL